MGRASRRRWPGLVLLFALVTGPLGWGLLIEPNRLIVRTETVALPRFPRLRIAMVADLHAGAPFVGEAKIREVVEELNRSQADLILLLGDYVIGHHAGDGVLGGTKMAPEQVAKALTGLRARLGVYAVLGNHDVWTHAPAMKRAFEGASIRVLDDEALFVPGASLW